MGNWLFQSEKDTPGAIVSAQEHNVMGGLGSAIAEILCSCEVQVPMGMAGGEDCHAESGPYKVIAAPSILCYGSLCFQWKSFLFGLDDSRIRMVCPWISC